VPGSLPLPSTLHRFHQRFHSHTVERLRFVLCY
jgi:hypothetical protein